MNRVFDRKPSFDERSRSFGVRSVVEDLPVKDQSWHSARILNQGQQGACVGFSWAGAMGAAPVGKHPQFGNTSARKLWSEAKQYDEWPGEDYDWSSVLGGAKACKERGLILSYKWAFSLDDLLRGLSNHGPAVLGINWYEGMFAPDPQGYVHPSGSLAGGHAILAIGVSASNQTVTLRNSWGRSWGRNGNCLIAWGDLDRLLHEDGEACLPSISTGLPSAVPKRSFLDRIASRVVKLPTPLF